MAKRAAAWALLALLALLELAAAKPMRDTSHGLYEGKAADVGPSEPPRGSEANSDSDSLLPDVPRRNDGAYALDWYPQEDGLCLPNPDQYCSSPRSVLVNVDNEELGMAAQAMVDMFRLLMDATKKARAHFKCWQREVEKWLSDSESGRWLRPRSLREFGHMPFSMRFDKDLMNAIKRYGLLARQRHANATLLNALRDFGRAREAAAAAAAEQLRSASSWGKFAAAKARRSRRAIAALPKMPCGISLERPLDIDLVNKLEQVITTDGGQPSVGWRDLMDTESYRCSNVSHYYGLRSHRATAVLDACNMPLPLEQLRLVLHVITDGCRAPGLFMDAGTESDVMTLRPSPEHSFSIINIKYDPLSMRLELYLWQKSTSNPIAVERVRLYSAVHFCVRDELKISAVAQTV